MVRILVFSERLRKPCDEGIKNTALALARALGKHHEVLTLTTLGEDIPEAGVANVPANPLLLSLPLAVRIGRFRPEMILYVPTACATPFSFIRARVLKVWGQGARVALLALQVRRYGRLAQLVMPCLQPDLVLVQAERTRASLAPFHPHLASLPPGLDLERFQPVSPERRAALRAHYGVSSEAYVALHVGHLNRGRNVQALAALPKLPGVQAIVAGSTSTPQDRELVHELARAGVLVIDRYLAEVAELYQLSDCYVFPVQGENSAIDVPLSVLEAMGCNLAVVTTRFGGLSTLLGPAPGLHYVAGPEELAEAVRACCTIQHPGTRQLVAPFGWERVATQLVETVMRPS